MKKYGKKWRRLHPDLASKPRANDIQKAQEQKRLRIERAQELERIRQTPMDRSTIKLLRKDAYALISVYQERDQKERELEQESNNKSNKNEDCLSVSEILKKLTWHTGRHPIFLPTAELKIPKNLKERLEENALEFVRAINPLFDFSIPNTSYYLFTVWKYDVEKHGIEPLGKHYIDALCEILEGSTWYTRKNSDWILEGIKKAFAKSGFIEKYQLIQ